MNNLFTDIGYLSLSKFGEELCGDQVNIVEIQDDTVIMVLADGLGSGVKACILATLTSKIIATMMARSMSIEECVSTIASTLPVCETRKIAYSTFTIIKITGNREAEIIQYDNPHVILLRDGTYKELPLTGLEIDGKTIYRSKVNVRENDVFLALSDGVLYAGVEETLNLDWQRDNVVDFMEKKVSSGLSAKSTAALLVDECNRLYAGKPSDDVTVCVISIRARQPVNLLIGPPQNPEDSGKMMALFFAKEGKRIICGGTTAGIAADFLHRKLRPEYETPDGEIPPTSQLEGVDLVTEGAITINRVVVYARDYLGENKRSFDWRYSRDGASRIARLLFDEATDITFYVGRAINPAHQIPTRDHSLSFNIKMRLVDELASCLKKMGKRVKISFF